MGASFCLRWTLERKTMPLLRVKIIIAVAGRRWQVSKYRLRSSLPTLGPTWLKQQVVPSWVHEHATGLWCQQQPSPGDLHVDDSLGSSGGGGNAAEIG